jgi:hypothetical protein
MAGKRKTYMAEFKLAAVKMITEQKLSVAGRVNRSETGIAVRRLHFGFFGMFLSPPSHCSPKSPITHSGVSDEPVHRSVRPSRQSVACPAGPPRSGNAWRPHASKLLGFPHSRHFPKLHVGYLLHVG